MTTAIDERARHSCGDCWKALDRGDSAGVTRTVQCWGQEMMMRYYEQRVCRGVLGRVSKQWGHCLWTKRYTRSRQRIMVSRQTTTTARMGPSLSSMARPRAAARAASTFSAQVGARMRASFDCLADKEALVTLRSSRRHRVQERGCCEWMTELREAEDT